MKSSLVVVEVILSQELSTLHNAGWRPRQEVLEPPCFVVMPERWRRYFLFTFIIFNLEKWEFFKKILCTIIFFVLKKRGFFYVCNISCISVLILYTIKKVFPNKTSSCKDLQRMTSLKSTN